MSGSSLKETIYTNITHIDPLDTDLTTFINGLSHSGILIKWQQNDNDRNKYLEVKNELIRIPNNNNNNKDHGTIQRRYLHCWIEPQRIINKTTFEFEYKLIIEHKNELYYSIFNVAYYQIKKLHQIASTSKHFPTRGYPTVHPDINIHKRSYRSQELQDDMKQEQKYMLLEEKLKYKGPGRKSFTFNTPREAQTHHLQYFGEVLCKLLNCPSFAMQNILYDTLNQTSEEKKQDDDAENMHNDLVKLLKQKAYRKLTAWRHNLKYLIRKYHNNNDDDTDEKDVLFKPVRKYGNIRQGRIKYSWKTPIKDEKFLSNITFHSVTVASRPNGVTGDHWAVIFEGKYHLLVLEYFLDPASDDDLGFVSFKLFPNNITGQRACWYSFCASRKDQTINKEVFVDRWSTLRKSFLPKSPFKKETTFNFIHELVKIWMSKPKYYMTSNNCQHFARNMYAAFDKGEAKFLNIQLDQRKMTLIIPSGPIGDGLKEGFSMDMFVDEAKKKIKYKQEDVLDNFVDIEKGIGVNEFVFEEDEEKDGNGNDIEEEEEDNDDEKKKKASKLLIDWRIPEHYIDTIIANMIKEKVIDPNDWDILMEHNQDDIDNYLVGKLGFTKPHSKRFKKEYIKWSENGKKIKL